jgi:hypothetical protein
VFPSLQVTSPEASLILLPPNDAVLSLKLESVITAIPTLLLRLVLKMAPPDCQKHNNKPIEAAVLELVRNEAFEE